MMNVLFVTYDFPFPLNSGGKNRAYHLIKYASGDDVSVHLLSFVRGEFNSQALIELKNIGVKEIKIYKRKKIESALTVAQNLISRDSIFKTLYYDKGFLKSLVGMIKKNKIDVVHFESSYTGYYIGNDLKRLKVKQVLGTENIEHLLYEGLKKESKNIVKKALFPYQIKRLKREEERMMRDADQRIAVTEKEAEIIKATTGKDCKIVENAVDTKELLFRRGKDVKNNVLFVGNFLYAPNVTAIRFFVKEIFPLVDKKTTLTVIGKNVFRVVSASERIIAKEFVDNLAEEYHGSDALVFPLKVGGGTNFKILEAMALGVPVIAFPDRLRNLNAKGGVHYLEAEDAKGFAENIKKVTGDKNFSRDIVDNARELVVENYSWEKIGKKLTRIWRSLL